MDIYQNIEEKLYNSNIYYKLNEKLNKYTSFKIGGECRILIIPKNVEELKNIIKIQKQVEEENNIIIRRLIIGNGSNMLVEDCGFDGIVILLNSDFAYMELVDETTIYTTSGTSLMRVCKFARDNSLSGLEFAYGIPATVGGAIYMNAGAYNGEIKDVLIRSCHIDKNGQEGYFEGDDIKLSYRHSAYTNSDYCISGGYFKLKKGNKDEINEKMEDLMNRRKTKQPLEYPSAGSTFKRPKYAFAAKLIEDCGLKGKSIGGAQVSEKHSGFIINKNNATCEDVKELIEYIKKEVYRQSGIQLECEVKLIK